MSEAVVYGIMAGKVAQATELVMEARKVVNLF